MTNKLFKEVLIRWQVYQIVTSSKVLESPSVESTETLFVCKSNLKVRDKKLKYKKLRKTLKEGRNKRKEKERKRELTAGGILIQ